MFFGFGRFSLTVATIIAGVVLIALQFRETSQASALLEKKCAQEEGQIGKLRGSDEWVCVKVVPVNIWLSNTPTSQRK